MNAMDQVETAIANLRLGDDHSKARALGGLRTIATLYPTAMHYDHLLSMAMDDGLVSDDEAQLLVVYSNIDDYVDDRDAYLTGDSDMGFGEGWG